MQLTVIQNSKHNFIKVPKVASWTVARTLQYNNNWKDLNEWEVDRSWNFIALIRHPIDRWLSGMATFLNGKDVDINRAVSNPIHDEHTEPQALYFEGLKVKLFKLENIQSLWRYLGIESDIHINKRRVSTLNITDEHKSKLMSFYSDDLDLWESVDAC